MCLLSMCPTGGYARNVVVALDSTYRIKSVLFFFRVQHDCAIPVSGITNIRIEFALK